jgi:hypothetical protein
MSDKKTGIASGKINGTKKEQPKKEIKLLDGLKSVIFGGKKK